jgi:hypothetical protein
MQPPHLWGGSPGGGYRGIRRGGFGGRGIDICKSIFKKTYIVLFLLSPGLFLELNLRYL